jgi:hypothetical protein
MRAGLSVGFVKVAQARETAWAEDHVTRLERFLAVARAQRGRAAQNEEHLLHPVVGMEMESGRAGQELVQRRSELLCAQRLTKEARVRMRISSPTLSHGSSA